LVTIAFADANEVFEHIGTSKVTYVTKAMRVSAEEIASLVNSFGVKTKPSPKMSGNKYLHGTKEGTICIEEHLKFKGKYDCKLLDADLKKIIMDTPLLQTLINKKEIEIIGEASRTRLLKEFKAYQQKQLDMEKKQADQLDSLLMDKPVSDWDGQIADDGMEAIQIDMTEDARAGNKPGMEDLMTQMGLGE